jgi:A/G-specific adenine glycosylase
MQTTLMPKKKKLTEFTHTVWDYYKKHGRHDLPWRKTKDPYKILVSEIMLQQTQVLRVAPKYAEFLKRFPTIKTLSEAPLRDVLRMWQGLGYNRRAVNLKRAAETIVKEYRSKFPIDKMSLMKLPGIGAATAGDLLAFAFNIPAVVVETNIRTVFIHHFFKNKQKISDKDILPFIEKTVDQDNPRDWYYALMDYGSFLKQKENNISKSLHYKKQAPFKGSNRELRSHILKLILKKKRTEKEILDLLDSPAPLISQNLIALQKEGAIRKSKDTYQV